MALIKLTKDGFVKIDATTFIDEGIKETSDIQNALKKQIDVIDPNILIISEEFAEWDGSKKRIDLLGINNNGEIIIIELKRTETGDHMDLQAVRYAAMISILTFSNAVDIYKKYLLKINSDLNAEDELNDFIGDNKSNFASDVKIILVSSNFSKELTTSVMWLNDRDLNISCYRFAPYKLDSEILIDVQRIIPIPEAESYQIKVKQQKEEKREILQNSRDYTKYTYNNESGLSKRELVLKLWLHYKSNNIEVTIDKFQKDFKDLGSKLFVEKEIAVKQQQKCKNNIPRYFLGEHESISIEDKLYVISNQWGANKQFESVIKRFEQLLGSNINEENDQLQI